GVYALVLLVPTFYMMDEALGPHTAAAMLFTKMIIAVAMLVFYGLIPGTMVLFYGSQNVRLTCEHHDPVIRWTDRCPPPVLGACLVHAFGILYLLPIGQFSGAI